LKNRQTNIIIKSWLRGYSPSCCTRQTAWYRLWWYLFQRSIYV